MDNNVKEDSQSFIERRNMLLKGIKRETIEKAWFTLAHILLDEGAKVVDMGCGDGSFTYAMAAMNPKVKFIGLDKSKRQINRAKETFELHNLSFKVGDASSDIFEDESIDAIINSYILHVVYSGSRYNEQIVRETLSSHFKALKKGGAMFIRDYAQPPSNQFVLIEFPDIEGTGDTLAEMSEAELLVWFAEHARPRQDPGFSGFFLEELPPRHPGTRLFRLPYKWAYEFVMRKDDRAHWETELPMEYTFYTVEEFRKELANHGARVQYSGPYWEESFIEKNFDNKFRLYADDGTLLGAPSTCFIAVAYKMAERKSLHIEERRPFESDESALTITAMQDRKSGRLVDVVSRGMELYEVLPFYVDEEERLKIYLHDGIARSISNAVPRRGINIDGKHWSGHMIEPIAVNMGVMEDIEAFDFKNSVKFAKNHIGLKPKSGECLIAGPRYYPDPAYIDERIHTLYLNVEKSDKALKPKSFADGSDQFLAKGKIREFDAQQVLDSITVGKIPNSRLEMQILALFERLKIKPENWTCKEASLQINKATSDKWLGKLMKMYKPEKDRFKNIKGSSGDLRNVHSVFVEEGHSRGSVTGLTSQKVDFVLHEEKTASTAVVLPLIKDLKGEAHAGFLLENMPVPQRFEGKSQTITAPSFNLPDSVTNIRQARRYVAEKFGVLPELVIKMGEPYFTHVGVTPHKIYPFVVTQPADLPKDPKTHFLPMHQLILLKLDKKFIKDPHFMTLIGRSYRYLNDSLKFDAKHEARLIANERFAAAKSDWGIPLSYHRGPNLPPAPESPAASRAYSQEQAPVEKQAAEMNSAAPPPQNDNKILQVGPGYTGSYKPFHLSQKDNGSAAAPALAQKEDMHELEAFIETLIKPDPAEPKPEKW